jgi:antitoxin (DNA-binding transcriptional repressor) of toxin-antitoxin stability system
LIDAVGQENRQPTLHWQPEDYFMKIENVRTAKASLNRLISDPPRSGSVIITKNGKPCAALMPITEDTDLEVLALSQNKRFWKIIDAAIARGEAAGFTDLDDLSIGLNLNSGTGVPACHDAQAFFRLRHRFLERGRASKKTLAHHGKQGRLPTSSSKQTL